MDILANVEDMLVVIGIGLGLFLIYRIRKAEHSTHIDAVEELKRSQANNKYDPYYRDSSRTYVDPYKGADHNYDESPYTPANDSFIARSERVATRVTGRINLAMAGTGSSISIAEATSSLILEDEDDEYYK